MKRKKSAEMVGLDNFFVAVLGREEVEDVVGRQLLHRHFQLAVFLDLEKGLGAGGLPHHGVLRIAGTK